MTNQAMHRRLRHHDYNGRGIYMLTLATEGRLPRFGDLTGTPLQARVELSRLGKCVEREIGELPVRYPELKILDYVIMPDHIHVLLFVRERMPQHLGRIVASLKAKCSQAWWAIEEEERDAALKRDTQNESQETQDERQETRGESQETRGERQETQDESQETRDERQETQDERQETRGESQDTQDERQGKREGKRERQNEKHDTEGEGNNAGNEENGAGNEESICRRPVNGTSVPAPPTRAAQQATRRPSLWEKGYHDRVLMHKGQLQTLHAYIQDNPRRLAIRRMKPDLFRVRQHLRIGGQEYASMGNIFLLKRPERLQVFMHRRATAEEIEQERKRLMMRCEEGAVLVTPGISPGEKAIVHAAIEEEMPLILLRENGFGEYEKPYGRYFEACAAGTLLILAPWEHHTDRHAISRLQCLTLNEMARTICDSATGFRLMPS